MKKFFRHIYNQWLFPLCGLGNFYWNAKNEHGIHSPFVFDLVTKCFYDQTKYAEYQSLKEYRKSLLADKRYIEVTDFGAGSRVFKSNKRQITKIAKTAGIFPRRAKLLFRIVRYFKPDTILEIGTSLGLATNAMAVGNPNSCIKSLEGCKNTLLVAKDLFQGSNFKCQVDFVLTEFKTYLKDFQLSAFNFQLIYFDGNHSKQATLDYFELLLPTVTNETLWIFDDIHWSPEMEQAWEIIKNHPKVTVTIDTFQWGLVFFRTEQRKEHFIIKSEKTLLSSLLEKIRFWKLK